jgi:CheY-like chemotaxis protein
MMQIEQTFTSDSPSHGVKFKHVMLIDDNPIDNLVNQQLIQSGQYSEKVTVSDDPAKALEVLKGLDESELPDLILLDIIMPGMDGFEFLERFAELPEVIRSVCKVVMLSTSDSFHHLNQANKNRYVRSFINKPLTPEKICALNI